MPRQPGLEALRDLSVGTGRQWSKGHPADRRCREAPDCRSASVGSSRSRAQGLGHSAFAQEYPHRHDGRILGGTRERFEPGSISPHPGSIFQRGVRQKKFGLTPRELEIVSAVVAGYSNKEIAEYFKISEDTVKHHLSNIFDKLGVSTRLELALFARQSSVAIEEYRVGSGTPKGEPSQAPYGTFVPCRVTSVLLAPGGIESDMGSRHA